MNADDLHSKNVMILSLYYIPVNLFVVYVLLTDCVGNGSDKQS